MSNQLETSERFFELCGNIYSNNIADNGIVKKTKSKTRRCLKCHRDFRTKTNHRICDLCTRSNQIIRNNIGVVEKR